MSYSRIVFEILDSNCLFWNYSRILHYSTVYNPTGDKFKVTNYGLISVLPCLSKILEKLITGKTRLISFIEKHHVLYPHQYGFQSNHSTIRALLDSIRN